MSGQERVERGRHGWPMLPLVLLVLALIDLRVELILLWDHLTVTSLTAAVRSHLLAVAVLVAQPSLWHHYRRSHR
ncbi:MAG: hypothetical protein KME02_02940 [Aphanothece saxicola GSE-SYN-MK-01-06B]|jgi:hypothetical protein|nr:hypothetical protein [Aphanothece saxicola GSE-SYN-MK-01-06B]